MYVFSTSALQSKKTSPKKELEFDLRNLIHPINYKPSPVTSKIFGPFLLWNLQELEYAVPPEANLTLTH